MGQSTSIFESSSENINNSISQISNSNCINSCLNAGNDVSIAIVNSTSNGNLTYSEACYITGASCVLKASLDDSLINSQSSSQKGEISQEENPITMFGQLATIGSSDEINESNYQSISNEVTQVINSTCQNPAEVTNNSLSVLVSGSTINGSMNFSEKGYVTNTQCVINNMVKNYTNNSQKNSQSATIKQGACLGSLGCIVGLIVLIFAFKLLTHDNHNNKQSPKPKTPSPKKSQAQGASSSQRTSPSQRSNVAETRA